MDFKSSLSLTRCFAFALVMRCAQNGISNENISCSQFMRNFRYGWRNWSQKYVKRREKKNLIMLAHSQYVTLKYIYIICKSLWTTFYIICSLSVFVSFSSPSRLLHLLLLLAAFFFSSSSSYDCFVHWTRMLSMAFTNKPTLMLRSC